MVPFEQFILQVILAGGGAAVIAVAVIRLLGSQWLDSHFQKRLQKLKHEHDRDLEALRFGISGMLDRSNKLTAREFEVLPQAWASVFDAYVETTRLLTRLRQSPDFSTAPDHLLEPVLASSELEEWEKQELRALPKSERTRYYIEREAVRELRRAKRAAQNAEFFLSKNSLFLDADIYSRLREFVNWTWEAISSHDLALEARRERGTFDFPRVDEEFRKESETKIRDLEEFIRQRFWSENKRAAPPA